MAEQDTPDQTGDGGGGTVSVADLQNELVGKKEELAQLRAERQQAELDQVEAIRAASLQGEIDRVQAEINVERSMLEVQQSQNPETVAAGGAVADTTLTQPGETSGGGEAPEVLTGDEAPYTPVPNNVPSAEAALDVNNPAPEGATQSSEDATTPTDESVQVEDGAVTAPSPDGAPEATDTTEAPPVSTVEPGTPTTENSEGSDA